MFKVPGIRARIKGAWNVTYDMTNESTYVNLSKPKYHHLSVETRRTTQICGGAEAVRSRCMNGSDESKRYFEH